MVAIIPSIASVLALSLGVSGPGGTIWSWIIGGIPIQATVLSVAEIASRYPTAGGLYFASSALAPAGWGPLAAWVSGLVSVCVIIACCEWAAHSNVDTTLTRSFIDHWLVIPHRLRHFASCA